MNELLNSSYDKDCLECELIIAWLVYELLLDEDDVDSSTKKS